MIRIIATSFVLLSHLVLSLLVVFGQVTVLAHTVRVVRFVRVAASMGHLGLTFAVVAIVTHVFSVVLPISVWTLVDLPALPLAWDLYRLVISFFRELGVVRLSNGLRWGVLV